MTKVPPPGTPDELSFFPLFFFFFFLIFIWLRPVLVAVARMACGILVPQPRFEPTSPALQADS